MFDSGLEFVRADFHLHTIKDKEFSYQGNPNEFVKDFVEALKNAGIKVGVITNHNKFDKGEYDAIRKAAKREDIFILPGVELTVKEGANGIHTLIVFNPEEWLQSGDDFVHNFLTSAFATIANPENKNEKCMFDLARTLQELDNYGKDYFIVFAHVDQDSGLFGECKGGLLRSLSSIVSFRPRVLGLQKAKKRDNITQFKQCFGFEPALVEGSDPKSLADIGKGDPTYLKIGEYTYSSVKFALQDSLYRVSKNAPEKKHGYIESISFQGGKLNGQCISFSPELNAIIGIRGSGKSALLEILRYVFDFSAQTDKEYKESLVKNVMGSGGKATVTVVDKHGKRYSVGRIFGERTYVLDQNGTNLNIDPKTLIEGIQYFGQKDLSHSTDHEKRLLEKIVNVRVASPPMLDTQVKELVESVDRLLDVNRIPSLILDAEQKKSELEHKMKVFKEQGVAEKLTKQTGYTTDKAKLDSAKRQVESVVKTILAAYEKNKSVVLPLKGYESKYNEELFMLARKELDKAEEKLKSIGSSLLEMDESAKALGLLQEKLKGMIDGLADEFAAIKREITDTKLDVDSFVTMTEDYEKINESIKKLKGEHEQKERIKQAFSTAARLRNDLLLEAFNAYHAETERINASQSEIRIEILFKGDRESFKSQLKSDMRGTGITDTKYQALCDAFADYTALIEDWILEDGKKARRILTQAEYDKLAEKLAALYNELLRKQVPDKVNIYYHDKLLRQHSIGQRASALILFILTQDNNEVIFIDQPEDDLDNKVIYDEVISEIIKKKPSIQFMFATHNANIPVLGDAERVLVAEYQDTKIDVSQGNIDLKTTQTQIVDIMEGGKEAFDRRQLIYTFWK